MEQEKGKRKREGGEGKARKKEAVEVKGGEEEEKGGEGEAR